MSCRPFKDTEEDILHAPIKNMSGKVKPYSEIVKYRKRFILELNLQTYADKISFGKQHNYCVCLIQKRACFSNLTIRDVTDIKTFFRKDEFTQQNYASGIKESLK